MKKNVLFLLVLTLFTSLTAKAQYATGGNGKYANSIYWLTWYWAENAESGLQSFVPKSTPNQTYKYNDRTKAEIKVDEGTYIWQISKYIRVQGVLSNKTGTIKKFAPNSWGTSGFQYMYKGFESKHQSIGNVDNDKTPVGFDLILNVQVLRNNVWQNIDPSNHGVVFTETESLSTTEEYVECLVDAQSSWYLIESNDSNRSVTPNRLIEECGYKITTTNVTDNNVAKKKVRIDNLNSSGQYGRYAILYAHGVNKFDKLRLVGQGITHIALGYLINQDVANAAGYEGAYHLQELVTSGNPTTKLVPLAATTKLCDKPTLSIPDAKLTTTVYIGNAPNVEDVEDANNNLDGITQSVAMIENVSTNLKMTFASTNTLSDMVAYAYVWLDKNNDKIFTADEASVFTIPANSTNVLNEILYNNLSLPSGEYVFRIRITTDLLEDNIATTNIDERSVKMASNGEVTDYIINVTPQPLPLTLTAFNGVAKTNFNQIDWTTTKESDISHFELQSKLNGDWKTIYTVAAQNKALLNEYSFNDYDFNNQALYRLYIVENNSELSSYSRIININRKVEQQISIYPNPAQENINIEHINVGDKITITNSIGQIVIHETAENKSIIVPVQSLTKGAYVVTITQNNQKIHQQTIIVK